MTNILRDVDEDWERVRLYLPLEELVAFGLSERDVDAGVVTDAWRRFMDFQIARTRRLYQQAWPGIQMLDVSGRLAIAAAAAFYRGILDEIERNDYDVFTQSAHVSAWRKLRQVPGLWWQTRGAHDKTVGLTKQVGNLRRKYTNRKLERMAYSMSLVVIYFGTKRRYLDSKLHHHNIIMNRRYRGLLRDIFGSKPLPDDFSLYLHMPTLTDPSIAPEGHESFYVLSPVPHLKSGTDWQAAAQPYRDRIMQFLEDNYLPDLQANIVTEHMIDPRHFQQTLNSYRGAAFSVKPSLLQSAWLRPHNRSEEFENLYFVGAGTHPGAGVPAVISSGKIAAELIDPTPVEASQRAQKRRETLAHVASL